MWLLIWNMSSLWWRVHLGSGREGSDAFVDVSQLFLEFFQGHEFATNLSSLRNFLQV